MTTFKINDKVSYTDQYGERTGTIIEINDKDQRARIKWEDRKLRTWIRFSALKLVCLFIILIMAISCTKSVETPEPQKPSMELCLGCKLDSMVKPIMQATCLGCTLDSTTKPVTNIRPCPGCTIDSIKHRRP